jgi:hypothetical protein
MAARKVQMLGEQAGGLLVHRLALAKARHVRALGSGRVPRLGAPNV